MNDKNNNPAATVIIPTYNRSTLINDAISSVLRQSFSDFELLVVDDGSTDDTAEIVKQNQDSRIKYFYKQNGGLASARNFGIPKSKGRYIVFLDDDDLFMEDFLKVIIENLEQNKEYGLAYCRYMDISTDGHEEVSFGPERFFSGFVTEHYFKKIPNILPSATMFRKSIFEKHLFDENLRLYEDQDFLLRISTTIKFLCVEEILVRRRRTPNSLSEQPESTYNPILVYERFYFLLDGHDKVPAMQFKLKLSHFHRKTARKYLQMGNQYAAKQHIKKAIGYFPFDFKNYKWLLKILLSHKKHNKRQDWQMPEPLPPYIIVNGQKSPVNISMTNSKTNDTKTSFQKDKHCEKTFMEDR